MGKIASVLLLCLAGSTAGCGHLGGFATTSPSTPGLFVETAPPVWPEPDEAPARVGPSSLLFPGGRDPAPESPPASPFVSPTGPLVASRYAGLSAAACAKEAEARKLPLVGATARDVAFPVRVTGPLGGVRFLMGGAKEPGGSSPHEILDCRLTLALADLGAILAAHGVVEVRHMSLYRPGARIARSGHPSRHGQGLAIDVGQVVFASGKKWSVLDDWHGAIGDAVCGGSPRLANEASLGLRGLVCDAASRGLFHLFLTPNHDRAHANHLHIDLEPGWTAVKVH